MLQATYPQSIVSYCHGRFQTQIRQPHTLILSVKHRLKLDPTHNYLAERGLLPQTIQTFGLGFCRSGLLKGHIAIPIHSATGTLVAYAACLPKKVFVYQERYITTNNGNGQNDNVFNLHRAISESSATPLIIVPGFFDAIRIWQLGCHRVVALAATEISWSQVYHILHHLKSPYRQIALLFDETPRGRAGREEALHMLSRYTFVRYFELPEEGLRPECLTAKDLRLIGLLTSP
jgi:hypothetical protein